MAKLSKKSRIVIIVAAVGFIYAEPLSDTLDKFLLQIKEFIIQISFEYEKDFSFDTFGIVEIDNAESTELEAMDSSEKKN